MCGNMSRKNGFTLIELLVVMSIIGLLVSILLPSLGGARRSAQSIVCASNLRQLAMGWSIYAQQSNGSIVPGRTSKFTGIGRRAPHLANQLCHVVTCGDKRECVRSKRSARVG